jgi:hypothetical protein
MSAVLRISAIVHDLDLPRNTFENDDAPIFTVINGGTSSLRPYGLTGPGCVEAIERVPRETSLRQTSDFLDPTAPARDGTDESVSNGQRSRSNETVYSHRSLGKGAMLAGPFPTTPCIERKPTLEPCQRRVPARDVVPFEHRVNVDNQDHEGDQTRKSGTLELSYTDSLLVTAEAPSIRKGSASNDPKVDPRCDQIRARKDDNSAIEPGRDVEPAGRARRNAMKLSQSARTAYKGNSNARAIESRSNGQMTTACRSVQHGSCISQSL